MFNKVNLILILFRGCVMGIFNRKKKEERILPLPEFPRLPNEPNFSFYDEQVDKKESFPKQEFKKITPTENFSFEKQMTPSFEKEDISFDDFVPRKSPLTTIERHDDKPLFVKVDKYKESAKTVEAIKSKLEEADAVLKTLTRLREEEEKELQEWQSSLDEVRQKLMKVDKDLFEV